MTDSETKTDDNDRLDPQMAAAMDKMAAIAAALPLLPAEPSIAESGRRYVEERRFWNEDPPPVRSVKDTRFYGPFREIPVRVYRPAPEDGRPAILHFHGGGWVKGNPETHDRLTRLLALEAGAVVVSVDYALAPEHKFPEPVKECVAAVEAFASSAKDWGADPARIAVSGDSAGANLALAAALDLRERRPGLVRALLLYYGIYDSELDTDSYRAYGDGRFGLSRADMVGYWGQYVRTGADRTDPRAAVLHADLHGLPPVFLGAAELDVLRDDSVTLAARLADADVAHELRVYDGLCHGFLGLTRMVDEAVTAIGDSAAFLAGVLTGPA